MTTPKGDIFKEVNSPPFKMGCHLNPEHAYYKEKNYRSSDIRMYYDSVDGERTFLEPTLVNSTSVEVTFNPEVQGSFGLSCVVRLRGTTQHRGVCRQNVVVGGT